MTLTNEDLLAISNVLDSKLDSRLKPIENKLDSQLKPIENKLDLLNIESQDMKKDINALNRQLMKSTAELKSMDEMILDEVERVHGILEKHKEDKTVHTA